MSKVTLEQLDNQGKPTGHSTEFDEDVAKRILARKKPKWQEAKGKTKTETKTDK